MYYIGIDLGTSAVKLLLMDETGSIANIVSREYPIAFPHPGWSEQDPADWWAAVCDGIPALLDGFDASQVKGIGAGGQMHGLVVLDKNDAVIRPCILWNDGRTQRQVDYLNGVIGKDKLSRYTANIAFAGFTAPKLLWMRDNEPDNFARIEKIMLPKDYINYKLTGVHCTDYSDASGMLLLDVEHKCWSNEMLDICGVQESQLPKLFESWQPVGTLTAEAAQTLGLPADVVVCAGAGDNAAAAVGCGAVGGGKCNISLGTSGTVFITSNTFGVDKQNALHSFAHADGGYHLMGCILSAASCNKWWSEEVLHTTDYAAEQTPITADKLGANDVYFLPYLMGERSPHNDPASRGAFVGLRMDTPRAALTQAVLEGVAFAIRDCVEIARAQGVKIKASTLCGGGAKSPLWREILAERAGHPADAAPDRARPRLRRRDAGGGGLRGIPQRAGLRRGARPRQEHNPAGRRARRKIQHALRRVAQAVPGTESILCGNGGTAMKIFSVTDPEFKPYGRVVTGLDTAKAEILAALANTPLPAATDYVAEDAALQELPAAVEVSEHLFGGMPCQLGWCNGHNTYLNCLEYHRDSEFNLGTEDFVLLLARQEEIAGGKLDTAKVKAFRVPAGTLVEVYATTLHYAPCHVDAAKGFRVLVALPKGTNTAKPAIKNDGGDDPQLWACNKWLLAHPDSAEAKAGAYVGLVGENVHI